MFQKKGNNSGKKQFFKNLKKKPSRIIHMMNVIPKFQSCGLNGVATNERTPLSRQIDRQIDRWIQGLARFPLLEKIIIINNGKTKIPTYF